VLDSTALVDAQARQGSSGSHGGMGREGR